MFLPAYKVIISTKIIDSNQTSSIGAMVSISTTASMAASAGVATIIFGQNMQQAIQKGDPVSIELGYGNQTTKVMEGTVENIKPNIETIVVTAYTPVQRLLALRLNQIYENQTAGAIVSDLASQVSIDTEKVEDGIHFPFYVIDDRQNAYEYLHDIAEKCGYDLYLNRDNKLIFKGFQRSSAAHALSYGKNIIRLKHFDGEPDYRNVVVRGESPASSQGTETSHWLTKSFEGFKGSTGADGPVLLVQDATIRTKEAADASAQGRKQIIERGKRQGIAETLGNPNIAIGDIMEINDVPQVNLNGVFQVRGVTHTLNKSTGFKTKISFWGVGD
jgi:phage protein D